MRRVFAAFLVLVLFAGAGFAEGVPEIALEDYPRVDGSTSMIPLSRALKRLVTGCSEEEVADLTHSKTTGSFYALVDGEADILLVAHPAQEALDYAQQQGVNLCITPIGREALVFLVSDLNPVDSVTQEQIVGIYTGEIANWADVGGEDLEIRAFQRNETAGSQVLMERVVMGDVQMAAPPLESRIGEMGELVDEIASYRNTADAIGYSVYFYVTEMYVQEGIKLLEIDGVAPAKETIASGVYPYTQPYYVVIREDAPEDSPQRKLYDFLLSGAGQALVEAQGYVPAEG